MYYDKTKYESLIMKSPLFSLDREQEQTAYKRESYKMVEYLYCYLLAINEREYEPYGSEILDVATRCIKNFDSSKGVFLHYFNSAWKQEYLHLLGDKRNSDNLCGIRIAENEKRSVQKYIKLAEKFDSCVSQQELFERVSAAMDIPIDKVKLLAQVSQLFVLGDSYQNKDGEEKSTLDLIPDETDLEQQIISSDSVAEFINRIEREYENLQRRQKAVISDMITIRILPVFEELNLPIAQYRFINMDIVKSYEITGVLPSQRQIADKYNRNEASVSRTMKEFLKKVKESKETEVKESGT